MKPRRAVAVGRSSRVVSTMSALLLALSLVSADASATLRRSGVVSTPDVALGYEAFGETHGRLPVFVVNGGPGLPHTYMLMNDMWARVASKRLVIFYDPRGTGASKRIRPGAPQDMEAQVADLEALRSKLSFEQIALVGDSFGGRIAMAYAAAHASHVAKLVLSDSASPSDGGEVHLLPETFPDVEEQGRVEQARLAATPPAAAQASLRNHFRMIFYSPAKRSAYLAHMGDLGFEPGVSQAVSEAVSKLDLTPKLAAFSFPTLVVTGRYDMNVAPLTAWRITHAIPGARLVILERSGHLPSFEEPVRYRQVLEHFLDGR